MWMSEVSTGFPLSEPTRWRLAVYSDAITSPALVQIIMTCDHTLSDGVSCVTMLQQVIGLLSDCADDEPDVAQRSKRQRFEQLPLMPSSTALMHGRSQASSTSAPQKAAAPSNSVVPTSMGAVHMIPATAARMPAANAVQKANLCAASRVLCASELTQLLAACRAERTSITSALAASVFAALANVVTEAEGGWAPLGNAARQEEPTAGQPVLCTVPVSLRRFYEPPITNEHVGFHIGMVRTIFDLESVRGRGEDGPHVPSLWQAARAWKATLDAGLAAGQHLELASAQAPTLEEMRAMVRSASSGFGRTKALTLSNRGAFELPCELVSFRHVNNIAAAGPTFQLNAVSFNGALFSTLTFVDPPIALALGHAIADEMLANLRAMASSQPHPQ